MQRQVWIMLASSRKALRPCQLQVHRNLITQALRQRFPPNKPLEEVQAAHGQAKCQLPLKKQAGSRARCRHAAHYLHGNQPCSAGYMACISTIIKGVPVGRQTPDAYIPVHALQGHGSAPVAVRVQLEARARRVCG